MPRRKEVRRLFVAKKPAGIGSNRFLSQLKRKYGVKKPTARHSGWVPKVKHSISKKSLRSRYRLPFRPQQLNRSCNHSKEKSPILRPNTPPGKSTGSVPTNLPEKQKRYNCYRSLPPFTISDCCTIATPSSPSKQPSVKEVISEVSAQ